MALGFGKVNAVVAVEKDVHDKFIRGWGGGGSIVIANPI